MTKADKLVAVLEIISQEMRPNGGSTMRDSLDRLNGHLALLSARHDAQLDLWPCGMMEADKAGAVVFVNRVWSEWTKCERTQAIGHGWLSTVHVEDRTRVLEAWESAVKDGRGFSVLFRLSHAVEGQCEVELWMHPCRVGPTITGFVATIQFVEHLT